jgi:hypothetical protein
MEIPDIGEERVNHPPHYQVLLNLIEITRDINRTVITIAERLTNLEREHFQLMNEVLQIKADVEGSDYDDQQD